MTALVEELVPDDLWAIVEPFLPPPHRPWCGGRVRTIPTRNCFAAIVYMTGTSTPWRLLPTQELGCGSPATAWRRLNESARRLAGGAAGSASWTPTRAMTAPPTVPGCGDGDHHTGRPAWDRVLDPVGAARWRVERALSRLGCYRRLAVRWDRGSGRFFAFVLLACALVCFKRL